jgi:epoxide hydrolase-like predicted phosphatase
MKTIKAVIFDWGGVLIDDPAPGLMRYCADALGVSKKKYTQTHLKFIAVFQTGKISESKFWSLICKSLKVSKPKLRSLWAEAFKTVYSPKAEMFAIAELLQKKGYKTAVLSDTEMPAMKYFYRQKYKMFDAKVFSCAVGIKKPDRRFYRLVLRKLKAKLHQAVFIDDRKVFLDGAKRAGLKTILFKSVRQVKAGLKKLGVETG